MRRATGQAGSPRPTPALQILRNQNRYEVTNGAVSSVETLSDDDKLKSAILYDA